MARTQTYPGGGGGGGLPTASGNEVVASPADGSSATVAPRALVVADLPALIDDTVNNVSDIKHGYAPKSPADATKFLNGAATPAYAQVKDSDLSTSDVTTNDVVSTKHGLAPKSPGDATKFLNGAATPAYAQVKDSDLSVSDITTNNVVSTKHGLAPKSPGDATKFLNGAATPAYAQIALSGASDAAITAPASGDILSYNSGTSKWTNGAVAVSTKANVTPDTPPNTPDVHDDEFDVGSSIDTAGTRFTGANAWSTLNPGSGGTLTTFGVARGALVITRPGTTTTNMRIVKQSLPAGNWKFRCKVNMLLQSFAPGGGAYVQLGIGIRNSTNSHMESIHRLWNGNDICIEMNRWNSETSYSSTVGSQTNTALIPNKWQDMYFEIEYNGTSLFFRWSPNGHDGTWTTLVTSTVATFMTSGGGSMDGLFLFCNNDNNSNATVGIFDWIRRIA